MFEMQSKQEILKRLKENIIKNNQSKVTGSFNNDMLAANSVEFEQAYAEINLMIESAFAETSWGDYLTKKASEHGVDRKKATKAVGKLKVKGEPGARIVTGSLFATESDIKFFTVDNAKIGDNGTTVVEIKAFEEGLIGNVDANLIVNIPMSIAGVMSCTNEEPTHDGFDEESDEKLLERFLFKVRYPATSGNKYHYYNWAMEVNGVGACKIIPLGEGLGTVKALIVNSDYETASDDIIQTVKKHIEDLRPIGATIFVISPQPKKINISVTVNGELNKELLRETITKYFKNKCFEIDYVSIAQVGRMILLQDDVIDYTNLKLNNTTGNIPLTDGELPTVGEINVVYS